MTRVGCDSPALDRLDEEAQVHEIVMHSIRLCRKKPFDIPSTPETWFPATLRKSQRNVPMVRPLEGLLVVSLEQAIAAPYCTRMLADNGARVIKIERPDGGDFARAYDTRARGLSSHFCLDQPLEGERHTWM